MDTSFRTHHFVACSVHCTNTELVAETVVHVSEIVEVRLLLNVIANYTRKKTLNLAMLNDIKSEAL